MSELKTIRQVQESELQGAAWKQAMEHVLTHCYSCSEPLDEQLALPLYDSTDRRWENMGYYGTNRRILQPSAFVCGKCAGSLVEDAGGRLIEKLSQLLDSVLPEQSTCDLPLVAHEIPPPDADLHKMQVHEMQAKYEAEAKRQKEEWAQLRDAALRGFAALEKFAEHSGAILELVRKGAERDGVA